MPTSAISRAVATDPSRHVPPDPAPPRLRLAIQYAAGTGRLPNRSWLRRRVARAARRELTVVVRFVGAAEGRRLNREFRGRDYATNVLTFVYETSARHAAGDLVICVPVLRREAREQGKPFEAHCTHLLVHGILHLQGYDHETDREARAMEGLETEIVTSFGYDRPYFQ
jgi:probable rRNA maturation factor